MNPYPIIKELSRNQNVFRDLLSGLTADEFRWKQSDEKWCLLEIVCHLYDEEREDFRARVKHTLETPHEPMPPIDPQGWVKERKYLDQDYDAMLAKFLTEREKSIQWLNALLDPKWENAYTHPKFGKMTAKMFLSNWLAHDYLHVRQILKLKFDLLAEITGEPLSYAGAW